MNYVCKMCLRAGRRAKDLKHDHDHRACAFCGSGHPIVVAMAKMKKSKPKVAPLQRVVKP